MQAMSHNDYRIELVPHHYDSSIEPDWYDPSGPVTYVGDPRFIEARRSVIREACDILRLKFQISRDVKDLRGTGLALALRLGQWQTSLNKKCKPQIKVENAIAAGIPVLITGHPAETSLHPSLVSMTNPNTNCPKKVAASMLEAIAKGVKQETAFSEQNYFDVIRKLIHD
jgi:hypothetical protein